MSFDTFTHVLEIVVLVALYFGLLCAVGVVCHEVGAQYPEPFEPPSHVRVLGGDES